MKRYRRERGMLKAVDRVTVKASGSRGAESFEKPPASSELHLWDHSGFTVKYNNGRSVVDKTVKVCRHCAKRKPYENGNTWSMGKHLK